jgi:hypothetical protein
MSTRTILFLFTLLIASGLLLTIREEIMSCSAQSTSNSTSSEKIPTVSFCDLVAHPELYHDKVVRVRAIYFANFESNMLYDPGCNRKENRVWFILDCDTDESCKAMRAKLDKSLEGDPFSGVRAELVMIGRLKLPTPSHRYGVQSGFRLGFAVTQIEEAIQIPSNASMPCYKYK